MRRKYGDEKKCVIGIVGASSGVGTTHISIAMTNFFSGIKRKKTALLEVNKGNQLKSISSDNEIFSIKNALYYPSVKQEDIPGLCNGKQEITILDLGNEYQRNRLEFLRCDIKIVIGSMSPWKQNAYLKLLDAIQKEENYKQWLRCFILFGNKNDKREISSTYHIVASAVPFIADPFNIGKKEKAFFEKSIL